MDDRRNLHFFEAPSMRELYAALDAWQVENQKRFVSLSVERDGGGFCCIVLTSPTEVVIMNGSPAGGAGVFSGRLSVGS